MRGTWGRPGRTSSLGSGGTPAASWLPRPARTPRRTGTAGVSCQRLASSAPPPASGRRGPGPHHQPCNRSPASTQGTRTPAPTCPQQRPCTATCTNKTVRITSGPARLQGGIVTGDASSPASPRFLTVFGAAAISPVPEQEAYRLVRAGDLDAVPALAAGCASRRTWLRCQAPAVPVSMTWHRPIAPTLITLCRHMNTL